MQYRKIQRRNTVAGGYPVPLDPHRKIIDLYRTVIAVNPAVAVDYLAVAGAYRKVSACYRKLTACCRKVADRYRSCTAPYRRRAGACRKVAGEGRKVAVGHRKVSRLHRIGTATRRSVSGVALFSFELLLILARVARLVIEKYRKEGIGAGRAKGLFWGVGSGTRSITANQKV